MDEVDASIIAYFAKDFMRSLAFSEYPDSIRRTLAHAWGRKRVLDFNPEEKKDLYNKITKGKK